MYLILYILFQYCFILLLLFVCFALFIEQIALCIANTVKTHFGQLVCHLPIETELIIILSFVSFVFSVWYEFVFYMLFIVSEFLVWYDSSPCVVIFLFCFKHNTDLFAVSKCISFFYNLLPRLGIKWSTRDTCFRNIVDATLPVHLTHVPVLTESVDFVARV